MVAAKTKAAWRFGLSFIIGIGETPAERRDRKALSAGGEQIAGVFLKLRSFRHHRSRL
jgi:triosephosphate isomerase